MDKKTAICQYLKKHHTGGERAVYSRELQRLFSIDGRGFCMPLSKTAELRWKSP